jgi:sulfhydrogenase subunit alpha
MLSGLETEMKRLLRLKEALNNVTGTIGGRPLHPVSMIAGGFTKVPSRREIGRLIKQLESVKADALETVKMVSHLKYPDLQSSTEYAALVSEDEYAVNEGRISTNSGIMFGLDKYNSYFREEEVSYSNAKRTVLRDRGYVMVGALARHNIKFNMLHDEARKVADLIGFKPLHRNPYFNITAQAVEILHCIWRCIELLESLTLKETLMTLKIREGSGAAATEAPRGLLYHQYELNKEGVIEKANLVTPTAYNFLSLEENLRTLIKENIDRPIEELTLLCETLLRAYDPCFSCSVH